MGEDGLPICGHLGGQRVVFAVTALPPRGDAAAAAALLTKELKVGGVGVCFGIAEEAAEGAGS